MLSTSPGGKKPGGARKEVAVVSARKGPKNTWPDAENYDLDAATGYMLARASSAAHSDLREHLADLDITPAQHIVIMRLFELEKVSQNDLGRRVGMKRATIHGVVKRMEQRGILRTSTNRDDQRLIMVRLTGRGRNLADELARRSTEASEGTFGSLSVREVATLRKLLSKIE